MSVGAPQPDDAFIQILAKFHECERARLDDAKTRLRDEIIPRLRQHGVANIDAA